MMNKFAIVAAAGILLTACAGRSDHQTFYHAEQGDYDAALQAAKAAQGSGLDGFLFGSGASQCRDYSAVVTVYVAKGDFTGATEACRDYDNQCAVVPDASLCFNYRQSDLNSAKSDDSMATQLSEAAREALHFRWLMIRDDYEGKDLKRPIY
ncbi:hypothetical protein R0135_14745 [Congregibacter variabilis]|uniref:Lipoprotein n=1 Tax=Congregibacter variabilis TaxID=3081200 RepID=A0ABZ0I1I0_9GAMM|nr:hypothetical protein R0135_14745 [Congregibacter sp. IMCC43200]